MRPLLLLSGLLSDATVWSDIPARLADVAAVQVISFRGFSSIPAMCAHVLKHAPPRFALAGHSMGGRVALEVLRAVPERVSALALLNTSVASVRDGEPQSRLALLRLAFDQGMEALAAEWLPPLLGSNLQRRAQVLPRLVAMIKSWSPQEYAAQVQAMLHRPDALVALSAVHVPTLLLSGSDDQWSPVSQHETMRRRIPHATLFEVHEAGHMSPTEKPEAVALALREWLASVD